MQPDKTSAPRLRPVSLSDQAPCEDCGKIGAIMDLGGTFLCEDCVSLRGSSCPEFGQEEMASEENQPPAETKGK